MEENYTKAFREVYIILTKTSKEELNKIPESFVEFIKKNMDMEYNPQIDFNDNFEKTVLEETLLILALIYRDYLISKEERQMLIQEEKKQLDELKERYSVENLFNKREQVAKDDDIYIEKQLMVIKEEKWYKKLLSKILTIFKSNK